MCSGELDGVTEKAVVGRVTKLPKYQKAYALWKVFVLKYYFETEDVELHFSEISFKKNKSEGKTILSSLLVIH